MITPDGSPISDPHQSGDGQNEFTFSPASSGILTMNLKAKVTPSGIASQIKDQCHFTVSAIGSSQLIWTPPANGVPTANGDYLEAIATFTGLPANNSDFGTKKAAINYDSIKIEEKDYEVFYEGVAANHPNGTATDPNWFYYYKDNAGGGTYTYISSGRSWCYSGCGDSTIRIGNEAYNGDEYITTTIVNGQLTATGISSVNEYYANFLGILAHERQHANNQINTGPPDDSDNDKLANTFETNTSNTDPNNPLSAQGGLPSSFTDDEVYAGGPIEQAGINGANTSHDWAKPGSNHN